MRWIAALAVGWLLLILAAGGARADDPEALRVFEQGRALAEKGKYDEACALYAKSYELERAAGTMLNLADCAERKGEFRRAWLLYEAAAAEYEKRQKPARVKFARERASALASKLATIIVRIAEPRTEGLAVRIGDREVPPDAEIVERLDAGQVQIVVGAPGRESFRTAVNAAGGEQVLVQVPALERARVAPPAPAPVRESSTRRRRGRVLLAAGVAGAGVLALGASGALAWSAKGLYDEQFRTSRCIDRPSPEPDDCQPDGLTAVERAGRRADLATFAGIGGGVLLVAGAVLYYTAPRERVTVEPLVSPRAAGLAVGGRF